MRIRLTDGQVFEGAENPAMRPAALYFTDKDGKELVVSVNAVQQVEVEAGPPVEEGEGEEKKLVQHYRAPKEGEIVTLPIVPIRAIQVE